MALLDFSAFRCFSCLPTTDPCLILYLVRDFHVTARRVFHVVVMNSSAYSSSTLPSLGPEHREDLSNRPRYLQLTMATPLAPSKTVMSNAAAPLKVTFKRPTDASVSLPRKKARTSPSTPTDEATFKIPALPTKSIPTAPTSLTLQRAHRALSPSTSTVAASSSPRRNLSSSPGPETRTVNKPRVRAEEITLQSGASLVFGRHRHRGDEAKSTPTRLESTVPKHLHHLISDKTAEAKTVYLAREAKHASRVHAVVQHLQEDERVRILVVGQNGLRVDGAKVLAGQRVEIERKERVKLDFYGARFVLRFPEAASEQREERMEVDEDVSRERLFTPESSPARTALSLPPSSPPLAPSTPGDMDLDMEEEEPRSPAEKDGLDALFRSSPPPVRPLSDRGSSPLSEASDAQYERDEEDEEVEVEVMAESAQPELEKEVKTELLESVHVKSRQPTPVEIEPIPSGVDLPALLASTVVFSGSSKLSLPDLVKHMLEVSCPYDPALTPVTTQPAGLRPRTKVECVGSRGPGEESDVWQSRPPRQGEFA